MLRVLWEQRIPLFRVARVRLSDGSREHRIRVDLGLRVAYATARFDSGDAAMGERTGEPVARRKRLAAVEERRHLGDDWKVEVAAAKDARVSAQRTPYLQG
jgi:hypothetical protein